MKIWSKVGDIISTWSLFSLQMRIQIQNKPPLVAGLTMTVIWSRKWVWNVFNFFPVQCFVCTALWTTVFFFFSAMKVRRLRDPKQPCTQPISSSSRAEFQRPTWGQNLPCFLASCPTLSVCFQLNPVLAYSLWRGKCCVGLCSYSVSWRCVNEVKDGIVYSGD